MKRTLFLLPLLSAAIVAGPAAAEDVYEMEEVIVTGSKLPQTPAT